ncbi:unnamed protein product, partial [Tuber aestivum]
DFVPPTPSVPHPAATIVGGLCRLFLYLLPQYIYKIQTLTHTPINRKPMDPQQQETPTLGASDKALQDELSTLRIFRATLESVKQVVDGIHRDTVTAKENCGAVVDLTKRWEEVILETSSSASAAAEPVPGGAAGVSPS